MKTMVLKPAEGCLVRQPDRNFDPVPVEGKKLPLNAFYKRRLNAGDLVEVKETKQPKQSAPVVKQSFGDKS